MNKFKVGDKVKLKSGICCVDLNHIDEYTVEKSHSNAVKVIGKELTYAVDVFRLYKEANETESGILSPLEAAEALMNKFKIGDKVVRVARTYGKAIKGGVYEVSGVSDKNEWAGSFRINLKGHDGVSGEFSYESSCFELYNDDVLSPLEAAEALMNKDKLQVFDSDAKKWYGFHNELRNITLEDLKHIKLRHKPKTVVINGVEVVAPINTAALGYPDKVWGLNLTRKSIYSTTGHTNRGLFWATEEDAQKALDAMLIPFKENNND